MDNGRGTSVGFLKSSKVRNAEEAIGQSEGLLTVLRLTQADIKPAEDALQIAKRFFDSNQFAKAFHAAKKAESLAITLDERFGVYQKAAKGLQSRIDSMRRLGLRTQELETLLARAEKKVLSGIWDSGAFVPNYLEARILVEQAEQEGRAFQERAERASNGIFLAELAIESLGEMTGPADPETFAQGATSALEGSLHEATRQLALGDPEGDDRGRGCRGPLCSVEARGIPFVRGRGRPPRRAAVDPRRELQPGGRVPRARPPRVRPPNERPGGARAGDRGSEEARAVPPGKWPLVPARHPRGPDAGGARIPPRELRRIERRPAPRDGPLGPGHARAEREELGGALKPGPWFSRRNGRALLCAAAESDASSGANWLRGPGSRVHVPDRYGRLLPRGDRLRDRTSARGTRDRPVRADPRSRMRLRCDRNRRGARVRGLPFHHDG